VGYNIFCHVASLASPPNKQAIDPAKVWASIQKNTAGLQLCGDVKKPTMHYNGHAKLGFDYWPAFL